VNGHWTAAKNNLDCAHFFIDAAIGRAIQRLSEQSFRFLTLGFDFMFNIAFGFALFTISMAIFVLVVIFAATFIAANMALPILCAAMFGMGIGMVLVADA